MKSEKSSALNISNTTISAFAWVMVAAMGSACGGDDKKSIKPDEDKDTHPTVQVGVVVTGDAVRACDLVLDVNAAATLNSVIFASGVKGVWQQAKPNTALAFTLTSDAPAGAAIATLDVTGVATSPVGIRKSTCFDREGRVVASASVSVAQ